MRFARSTPPAGLENCTLEARRIALLLERDGEKTAADWVKRTLAIYRSAVLDRGHFASLPGYREQYLASCADFRAWLRHSKAQQLEKGV